MNYSVSTKKALVVAIIGLALLPTIVFASHIPFSTYEAAYNQARASGMGPAMVSRYNERSWNALTGTEHAVQDIEMGKLDAWNKSKTPQEFVEKAKEVQKKIAELPQSTGSCSFIVSWFTDFGRCFFTPLLTFLGQTFVVVGGFLLMAAGYLFDMLVTHVIVGFGATLGESGMNIIGGIHDAWTLMRDVSNIIIIGMFVFIAISMILGIEQFGAKKLVARVLIIAVLINFSLLFSKIIIDAGNFVATQIYRQATPSDNSWGISDQFFRIMGITSIWGNGEVAEAFGNAVRQRLEGQTPSQNGITQRFWNIARAGLAAFAYGLVCGALLLFAAGIIFYGCYLIMTRAVLLVFLMLTSAIAFASYLVPKLSDSGYGWKTWWRSLLNASVFGPLLMLFLYISLLILSGAQVARGSGSLADFAANPANIEANWKILMAYVFAVGLLYVSFRAANSFSKTIAGFGAAGAPVGRLMGLAAGTAAFAGRAAFGTAALGLMRTGLARTPTWAGGNIIRGGLNMAARSNWDIRSFPGAGGAIKQTGVNFGKPQEGGWMKSLADREKRIIEAESARYAMVTKPSAGDKKREGEKIRLEAANLAAGDEAKRLQGLADTHDRSTATPRALSAQQGSDWTGYGAGGAAPQGTLQQPQIASGRTVETEYSQKRHEQEIALREARVKAYEGRGGTTPDMGALATRAAADPDLLRALGTTVDKLRELDETMKKNATRIAQIKASSPDERGKKYEKAVLENKYYFSFPTDVFGRRSEKDTSGLHTQIVGAARKTSEQKIIEELAKNLASGKVQLTQNAPAGTQNTAAKPANGNGKPTT